MDRDSSGGKFSPFGRGDPRVLSLTSADEHLLAGDGYVPFVAGVAVVGVHVLRLLFSDGTAGDVSFPAGQWTGFLSPLNDPVFFARVTVDRKAGTLVWPGGIDLPPEPLYEQVKAHPLLPCREEQPGEHDHDHDDRDRSHDVSHSLTLISPGALPER